MLDLESELFRVQYLAGVTFCFKFYNPYLQKIARSDRIGFMTKNSFGSLVILCSLGLSMIRHFNLTMKQCSLQEKMAVFNKFQKKMCEDR